MIALASSRILELSARLWKGCRPLVQNPFHDMFLHPEASPVADGEGAIFTRV
jgi:hypothetical protein